MAGIEDLPLPDQGGATTDFGVVVRQEKTIFPGVRLVRQIDDYYPCADVMVRPDTAGFAVISGQYCPDLANPRRYSLKSFVYF
jgi:hypothetical protein